MAKTSIDGQELVKRFERCHLVAYQDPGGVWTIGWGHTGLVNGVAVGRGMRLTQEQADEILRQDLKRFEKCVENGLTHSANQAQFDAMVSFAFNVGCGRAADPERGIKPLGFRGSTLLRMFNDGDMYGAAAQFARWNKQGPKVLKGLTRRRAVEAAMFLGEDWEEAYREAYSR